MKNDKRRSATVLLSGGIDSSACIHFYKSHKFSVSPIFIEYGQPASKAEMKSARAISSFYGLQLHMVSFLGAQIPKSGEILGRNLLLLAASLIATSGRTNLIAFGIHSGTRYFDCGEVFSKLSNEMLDGYTDGRVQMGLPFLKMNKAQIWKYCKVNKVPIHLTWSCESSSKKPCGKCLSCIDKRSLIAGA